MKLNNFPKTYRLLLFSVVLSVLGTTFGLYAYQLLYAPNVLLQSDERSLLIDPQDGYRDVLKKLQTGNYLGNVTSFAFIAKLKGYPKRVQAGHYVLSSGMNNLELLGKLEKGAQTPVKVRFHGLRELEDLPFRLEKQLAMSAESLLDYLCQDSLPAHYGFSEETFPLMFIPNTYEVYWTISPQLFVKRMHQEYNNFWDSTRLAAAQKINLSPQEVGVLAAIVQAETQKDFEKRKISGVYINRLQRNIPLSACPTLVYAMKDFNMRRVLNKHKAVRSPYNTYLYAGLPPGAINLPEIGSIQAVLEAETHKYLYFCASPDFSGAHVFATNLRAHLKNARAYQRALNKARIYK